MLIKSSRYPTSDFHLHFVNWERTLLVLGIIGRRNCLLSLHSLASYLLLIHYISSTAITTTLGVTGMGEKTTVGV